MTYNFILTELIIDFSYERLIIIWIIWTMLELQLRCFTLAPQELHLDYARITTIVFCICATRILLVFRVIRAREDLLEVIEGRQC